LLELGFDDTAPNRPVTISLTEAKEFPVNFLRHYYDVYCLLELDEVQAFMKTPAYPKRKEQRFRSGDELMIAKNAAFTLKDPAQRAFFAREYKKSAALYHQGQPDFDQLLDRIGQHLDSM
jgi:hypothetical protein